jgi:hypothetical protein
VNKGNQTITFNALPNRTYGDTFALSATASSVLPVSFSIVSGPATVVGNNLTVTGTGTITVRASQNGNANWNAAATADQSFDAAQATLSVTAENKSRAYGSANPALTASYLGFVNGDSTNVLSGTVTTTSWSGVGAGACCSDETRTSLSTMPEP